MSETERRSEISRWYRLKKALVSKSIKWFSSKGFFIAQIGEIMNVELVDFVHSQNGQSDLYQGNFDGTKLLEETVCWFEAFASDLRTKNLSRRYLGPLVNKTAIDGCFSSEMAIQVGAKAFHGVAKDLLGPLHVAYVDTILKTANPGDTLLFAARDSTPFYWIAKTLLEENPENYKEGFSVVHADWNRWFMGQEDFTDPDKQPLPWGHPLLQKFYYQMGFGTDRMVKIVEPGCWGSAAKAVKQNMPNQNFELWFLFSHMPDRIFGFLNHTAPNLPETVYEMINDTGEAQPKFYVRPEELVEYNGLVVPDLTGKWIPSPAIQAWAHASRQGSIAAAIEYGGKKIDIASHVDYLGYLSKKAYYEGIWTGMLPENTESWEEGDAWKANWSLGSIQPLVEKGLIYEI